MARPTERGDLGRAMKCQKPRWTRPTIQQVNIADSVLDPPIVTYLTFKKMWRLIGEYQYRRFAHLIIMPEGFEFDLASIPRLFWRLIAPFELSITAPLLHDFLYLYGGDPPAGATKPPHRYSRKAADILFKDVMAEEAVPRWRRVIAYWSVRAFGWRVWRGGS